MSTRHQYTATVAWQRRPGEKYTDNRYSRAHEWRFDGGLAVPASSSPKVVPPPWSAENAVDPEEAFIAALSACHMLFFLYHAARDGYVVERYTDEAVGTMGKNAQGHTAMLEVVLRPQIEFGGDQRPAADELETLHHRAHEDCYLANSVTTVVRVEGR
ncbi:MAG: OsmC family protein [Sinobacteraceae bacterium]|nr:OsmC family protein [Nevskia sp.]MDI3260096.1 OsmC family protein [Nevskiaceae bacterium]